VVGVGIVGGFCGGVLGVTGVFGVVGVEGVLGELPGMASGRSPPGCSPPPPGGWFPGSAGLTGPFAGGVLAGGVLPGVILPAPGGMPAKPAGPLPSESEEEEQAMRTIANPTKPNPAVDAFTIGLMRETPPSDRRKRASR
jgi:hypothetical protein